jgi:hypothetical protein
VTCRTCYCSSDSGVQAAAVLWRAIKSTDYWRVAVWHQDGAQDELAAVLAQALGQIYDEGGIGVAMIASRLDTDLTALASRYHFVPARMRWPLSVFTERSTSQSVDELTGLSFLDEDLSYRF